MAFDTETGRIASEVSTAARTASWGNNSTGSFGDSAARQINQASNQDTAAVAPLSEPVDASSSGRSLRLRNVFSHSKRGSFVRSVRSSIRSSFLSSGNLSDDDSLEAEHHGFDDLTPRSPGRRRSSLFKTRFSSSRRSSAFNSRSSIESSATGGRSKRSSTVNRKSSLDLLRASGGEYRPRAEHPLLSNDPPNEDKTQRRGSFLGAAMRKLSMGMSGSANTASPSSGSSRSSSNRLLKRTKSAGALASAASSSASPLSASDHGPHTRRRKGSFFGNLRKGSSAKHLPSEDEDPTQSLSLSNHF